MNFLPLSGSKNSSQVSPMQKRMSFWDVSGKLSDNFGYKYKNHIDMRPLIDYSFSSRKLGL